MLSRELPLFYIVYMSHNLYVKNIGKVATPKGNKAIHGKAMGELDILMGPAAIVIRDGIIAYVGKESEVPGDLIQDCAVYDAQGGAVVPGFVDSHTHLVFGGFREEEFQMRLRGASYMSIMQAGGGIASTTKATREASVEELEAAAQVHLRAMLSMGVTTADAKSGYGMDLETELRQLEVIQRLQKSQPIALHATFMGAHDTPPEFKGRSRTTSSIWYRRYSPRLRAEGLPSAATYLQKRESSTTSRLVACSMRLALWASPSRCMPMRLCPLVVPNWLRSLGASLPTICFKSQKRELPHSLILIRWLPYYPARLSA